MASGASDSACGEVEPDGASATRAVQTAAIANGGRPFRAAGRGLSLPRLALVFDPRSFSAWALTDAAWRLCELVWVIDRSVPETDVMAALLGRTGKLVDVTGLTAARAAAAIAATAPVGIVALKDRRLAWTADIAARLGLPFMDSAVAERLSDKLLQRRAMRDAGVPVPGFWPIPFPDDFKAWEALEREVRFPAVLKPRRGEASHDTTRVDSFAQLRARVAETSAPDGTLLLEEFLSGRADAGGAGFASYVSVESVVSRGRISHVAITGRPPLAEPFRETGAIVPSAIGGADADAVLEMAGAAIAALRLSLGCVHTELSLTAEGPRVIEVNGRVGGIPTVIAAATGIDMLSIALRLAIGEDVVFDSLAPTRAVAYRLCGYAPPESSRVLAVTGLDQWCARANVMDVILDHGPGERIDWRDGSDSRVFTVHGTAADHDELRQIIADLQNEITIVSE
jgi:biotin carboxylase